MRKINIIPDCILLVFVLMTISCKKDFLDKNPLDQISSGTFWKTEDDVKMALTGCYSRLQSNFLGFDRVFLEAYSDNAYEQFTWWFDFADFQLGNINPSTSTLHKFYDNPYSGIASCNFFLENVDKTPISDDAKNEYKAEVKFLRALFYFDLVNYFGPVIIYKETPADVDAAKIKQSSIADALAFIYEDLDNAIANLPDTRYESNAVKGSAMALKVRVLLYDKKWQEAADLANQIITGGVFQLSTDYKGLFLTTTQQDNSEIMFSTRYSSPNNYQGDYLGYDIQLGWQAWIGATQDLIDDYECIDGKPISLSSLYDPANPYKNRDPRLDMTIRLPGEIWLDPSGVNFPTDPNPTGYSFEKYVDLSRLPFSYSKANLTDQAMIHIRYADVLLMYAEAKNEVSGPDAGVYQAINEVRGRQGINMPPVDETIYNTQATLRDYIRHERRVEFALEGERFFDIRRWHIADTKFPTLKNPAGVPLKFDEKNYLLPFPQSEIDIDPELDQNPGY